MIGVRSYSGCTYLLNAIDCPWMDEGRVTLLEPLCEKRHSEGVHIPVWVVGRVAGLMGPYGHLSVSGSSHRTLVNVGRPHQNVRVVDCKAN